MESLGWALWRWRSICEPNLDVQVRLCRRVLADRGPAKDDHVTSIAASSVGGAALALGGATLVYRLRKNA